MAKILVADDSIAVRKVAERLLTEAGLGVTLAANGEEALAVLSKDRPDVIVSDVIMPDKSGYEICTFVRGHAMLAATPVLLISGIVNDEVTKQAEACRADGILKKPFQGTALKDRVLELLAKRQAQAPAAKPEATPAQPADSMPRADHWLQLADGDRGADRQAAGKLREVEEQLRAERARGEHLAKRMAELEGEAVRSKDLAAKVATLERQAALVPQLEAALKAERDAASKLKHEAAAWQEASGRVSELEAALQAERKAAAQLVQQVTDLERAAARVADLEAKLTREEQRVSESQQKAQATEAALFAEQQRRTEIERRFTEAEGAVTKVPELEVLLATERERNGLLARRVAEAETATQNATKRFEDMARKLGEIAGLASQLGSGKGQS